jgi:hypothetical protein
MTRKDFLRTGFGALAGVLAFLGLMKCSSNPAGPSTSKTFSSSSENGHSHTYTIQKAEVESPPAAGISGSTSSTSGHSHSFAMTQAELQSVMGGGTAVITTGSVDSGGLHAHTFTITKWF